MVLVLPRLLEKGEGSAEVVVAGEHRQERRSDVLDLHGGLTAAFDDDRRPPWNAVETEGRRQLHERTRIFRPDVHVDRAIGILAEIHALPAAGDGIGVKKLVPQRRPEQMASPRLCPVFGAACHDLVARKGGVPIGAGHLAIHGLAGNTQRVVRLHGSYGDIVRPQGRLNAGDKSGMPGGHDLAAEIDPLRPDDAADLLRVRRILGLELLALLFGQDRCAGPDLEVSGLPAHQLRPKRRALIQDVLHVEADFSGDRPASVEVDALDLDQRRVRVGDVPTDDRMPFGLQRAGEIETHGLGDGLVVCTLRHALHAVDAQPGAVVTPLGDQRIIVRRLEVAVGGERLLER